MWNAFKFHILLSLEWSELMWHTVGRPPIKCPTIFKAQLSAWLQEFAPGKIVTICWKCYLLWKKTAIMVWSTNFVAIIFLIYCFEIYSPWKISNKIINITKDFKQFIEDRFFSNFYPVILIFYIMTKKLERKKNRHVQNGYFVEIS